FFETDRFTCFRAGKTGEYGYDLLVPRAHLSAVREQILDVGRAFELRVASRDTIDLCALEAGFFNVRHEVRPGMTPVELQLQWRVTAGRVPGLARHRPTQRCVTFAAPGPLVPDADVELAGAGVGRVLHARFSPTRGEYLGIALVDIGVAYAGLRGFRAGETPLRTIASPAVNNRSLYVDPQRHTFSSRDTTAWPPLVRGVP
ncbi:MAG TPA: hypothetical protein VK427_12410, partial [Kofleriaceae bacterium]|nr:hypothetical protein [Kofleriaceae bacterium]